MMHRAQRSYFRSIAVQRCGDRDMPMLPPLRHFHRSCSCSASRPRIPDIVKSEPQNNPVEQFAADISRAILEILGSDKQIPLGYGPSPLVQAAGRLRHLHAIGQFDGFRVGIDRRGAGHYDQHSPHLPLHGFRADDDDRAALGGIAV